jgi:succinate dehydrogenase / fumarate reductase membrane anchor subunit
MATTSSSDLRSKLAKAKGLGTAHHGFGHWWLQRLTALALIPLSVWFTYELLTVMLHADRYIAAQWFRHSAHAVLMVLFLAVTFAHAKLGAQVVVEDYVKQPVVKYVLLLVNTFVCFALGALSILAVLKLHFGLVG